MAAKVPGPPGQTNVVAGLLVHAGQNGFLAPLQIDPHARRRLNRPGGLDKAETLESFRLRIVGVRFEDQRESPAGAAGLHEVREHRLPRADRAAGDVGDADAREDLAQQDLGPGIAAFQTQRPPAVPGLQLAPGGSLKEVGLWVPKEKRLPLACG